MTNAFRARLCFGCPNRIDSPHVEGLSKCEHPEALKELAYILQGEDGGKVAIPYPRPMGVKLYVAVASKGADWPYAYDPLVVDHCDEHPAMQKARA